MALHIPIKEKTTRKMTDNPVVQRIVGLIREQGKKEKDLTDHIRIAPGAISKWEYDGSYVYIKYIYEICEFLDTTPNYLFLGQKMRKRDCRLWKRN